MATVKQFLNNKNRIEVFVQVGTNNGADRFRELVREFNPKRVLLIEPNKDMIPEIKNNYRGARGVIIENVAISTKEGVESLYLPWTNDNGRADNGCYYGASKFSIVPQNDWGVKDKMNKIDAYSIRLDTLLAKYSITYVDYLCIDTEGYDAEVLKSLDIYDKIVDIIQYENYGFDSTLFSRHNENWDSLGDKAMEWIKGVLSSMGYKFHKDSEDTSNTIAVTNRQEVWKEQE